MWKKIIITIAILTGIVTVLVLSALIYLTIPRVRTLPKVSLNRQEEQEIEKLLRKNVFSSANLLPYRIDKDGIGHTHMRVYQIYKGVMINEEIILHFNSASGLFESLSGNPVPNIPISAGTIVSNDDLVKKSTKLIGEDLSYYYSVARPVNIGIKTKISAIRAAITARMTADFWIAWLPLDAQLSVYNANSGSGKPQDWILAWTITPRDSEYPVLVMDANTGETLRSFSGIFTF